MTQRASTLQAVEAGNLFIPLRPQDATEAERKLVVAEQAALAREQVILDYRTEINALVTPLFEAVPNPAIHSLAPLGFTVSSR
jgi:hypothetical protein